jgi:hypothetical protein
VLAVSPHVISTIKQYQKRPDTVAQFILDKICSIKMVQIHMSIFERVLSVKSQRLSVFGREGEEKMKSDKSLIDGFRGFGRKTPTTGSASEVRLTPLKGRVFFGR